MDWKRLFEFRDVLIGTISSLFLASRAVVDAQFMNNENNLTDAGRGNNQEALIVKAVGQGRLELY